MTQDGSRERILLRRARFVTAALAGLAGCNPTPRPGEPAKADPSTKPLPSVSATASGLPHEEETPDGLPPVATPAGVSGIAKEQYERLARQVKGVHQALAKAANGIPGCSIADEDCKKKFAEVADQLVTAEHGIHELGPRCPGSSKDAKAVDARVEEHRTFAKERLTRIKKRVIAALESQGPPARKAWEDLLKGAEDAHPEPCLKFACPEW